MPLNLSLNPSSDGEVFISTYDAIIGNIVPTTLLPSSHPFRDFWMKHLAALCQPGLYDTVIDALIALTQRNASWRRKKTTDAIVAMRIEMREVFRQHPPNVVVVSGLGNSYGFHIRDPLFWPYIHISEEYVNLWKDSDGSSEKGLALTVLIAAAIDHEIGHWVFTLTAGCFSSEQLNVPIARTQAGSREGLEDDIHKHTPKKLGVEWTADSDFGEAGDFVEIHSRGGIVGYLKQVHNAYIRTGEKEEDVRVLPLSYLATCLENSPVKTQRPSLRFMPPRPGGSPSTGTKMKNMFFPWIADSCAQLSSSGSASESADVFYRPHCESRIRSGIIRRELLGERTRLEPKQT